jgi:hypothetical protein
MSVKSPIRMIFCLCVSLVLGVPAFAACSLTKVTQMPLTKLGNHYAVMVHIEDEVLPMIVDTGAPTTFISLNVANDLELKVDPSLEHVTPVAGMGTKAEVHPNVIPSVMAFGDLVYHDRSTIVARQDWGKSPEQESIGLLGDDILSQYDVEFDFPGEKLTFYHASGCYDSFIPWSGHYSTIPFLHDDTKIVIDVILNDEREQAVVDTGNNLSFVSQKLLKHWRVDPSTLANTGIKMGSPLNGGTPSALKLFLFDVMKIGYDEFPKTPMGILDMNFSFAPVNLGMDFWKSYKVWISYPNKWMFISKNPSTTLAYPVRATEQKNAAADTENAPEKERLPQ